MSDCSTQAMMPKEPPRTCGMCDRYYNVRPIMRQGACALDGLDESSMAKPVLMIHHGITVRFDSACDAERRTGIPSQSIQRCCAGKATTTHGAAFAYSMPSTGFSDELRALGVLADG